MLNRKRMKENSKGLSRVGAIILIVLIVLILSAYFVVKDVVLKGSEERTLGKYTLDLKISQVQILENNSLLVMIKRNQGKGQFVGIDFTVEDGKDKEVIRTNDSLQELESRVILLNLHIINVSNAKKISIEPVFKLESKKEVSGNIEDEYTFGSSEDSSGCIVYCPAQYQCGDDGCKGECAGGCTEQGHTCIDHKCIADLETKCLETNITVNEVSNIGTNFSVTLSRNGGDEEIKGVKLLFTNELESSNFVTDLEGNIAPSESIIKYITILEEHLENPKKVRTMVYFTDDSGIEQLCESSDNFSF
jgi:hypothetical protein